MVNLAEEWIRIAWIPDRRPIADWAADNVTLPPVLTFQGKFDPQISRQFLGPLESLANDRVREVNILAPPRSGKTLVADTFAPHALARDPGPLLWVFGTDDQAAKHCELRLMPIIKACPPIRALLSTDRHKTRNTELQLANGYPLHVVGPATGNLQARGYRYLICDEVWEWKAGKLVEAKARLGDFRKVESSKCLVISQGGEGGGEWFAQYTAGVVHEWEVPCDGCGQYQVPAFSGKHDDGRRYGIVWEADKSPDGQHDIEQAKASCRYVCRHCGHEHRECKKTQARWNVSGRYQRQDGGDPEIHSFHWNDIISAPWKDIVADFLRAKWQARRGNWEPLIKWRQKRLAEFASERSIMEEEQPVFRQEIAADSDWPEEAARFMTVDVQRGHFWVMVCAWSKTGESRRLHWSKAQEVSDLEEIQQRLKVPNTHVILDAADQSRAVYAIAAPRNWRCIKGDPRYSWRHKVEERGQLLKMVEKAWSQPWLGDPEPTGANVNKSLRAKCWHISKPATADRLQGLRDANLWVEPKVDPMTPEEEDYQKQMSSMVKVSRKPGESAKWEQVGAAEPHAWDVARIQVWCAMMKGFA